MSVMAKTSRHASVNALTQVPTCVYAFLMNRRTRILAEDLKGTWASDVHASAILLFVVWMSILLAGPHPANSHRIALIAAGASRLDFGGVLSASLEADAWYSYTDLTVTKSPETPHLQGMLLQGKRT